MSTYYPLRAFEILRREGLIKLITKTVSYFNLRWGKYRINTRKNQFMTALQYDAVADPYKIVNIDPKLINKYLPEAPWGRIKNVWGKVLDGDWDKKMTMPIWEHCRFRAFKKHFRDGTAWKDTSIIDYQVSQRDLPYNGCETKEELRRYYVEYYKKYDRLYDDIRKQGFKMLSGKGLKVTKVPNTIIGRNGEFIFRGDGHHRVAIAKVLELDEIPVHVCMRHKQWQETRDQIHNNGLPEEDENLRDHPDLQDILN